MSGIARVLPRVAVCSLLAAAVFCGVAAKTGAIKRLKLDPDAPRVELFDAMADGTLEVRVSPRDEFEVNVFITNTSDKPVTVVAPHAIAAAQVMKQFLPPGAGTTGLGQFGNVGPFGQNDPNGSAQSVGGQFGPFGAQGNNSGTGANSPFFGSGSFFFSVPAEKTVQVAIHSVCLDYGKRGPLPSMKYELRKLEDHADNPALVSLFQTRDVLQMDRKVLQAAAWHLANNLSFAQMSTLMGNNGVPVPMFTKDQLRAAQELVNEARKNAGPGAAPSKQAGPSPLAGPTSAAAASKRTAR